MISSYKTSTAPLVVHRSVGFQSRSNIKVHSSTRPVALNKQANLAFNGIAPLQRKAFSNARAVFHQKRITPIVAAASSSSPAPSASNLLAGVSALANAATTFFPVFVVGAAALGLAKPAAFNWFQNSFMSAALGITMLGMGLTLTKEDIDRVFASPARIFMGFSLQYTIMPLLGFLLSRFAGLPLPYAIGLSLVACCPGGTASNVVTYIAKADMPLSVAMTAASTLGATVMTPLLSSLIIGQLVPVDALALLVSTVQVVLLPVVVGYTLNRLFPKVVGALTPLSALSAVVLIAAICGSVVAQNANAIAQAGPQLLAAIFALHAGGFALGYFASKFIGAPESVSRTNSIEVGMQNSALGALLAVTHFPAHPLAAVPCAISACTHSVLGSLLAAYWRGQPTENDGGAPVVSSVSTRSGVSGLWKLDLLAASQEEREETRKKVIQKWVSEWKARITSTSADGAAAVSGSEDDIQARKKQVQEWIRKYQARSANVDDVATRKNAAQAWIAAWRQRTGVWWL